MFEKVKQFETEIAKFFNAPYAVATDCCTHAIELCLRYTGANNVGCPAHTYVSIPFTFEKCGLDWEFDNRTWKNYYYITNTNIVDAAPFWKKDGYIENTFMCISFQNKKHLNLGRGGIILCDNHNDYLQLSKMSYDGRDVLKPWREDSITAIGYHYYMTPETANLGLEKLKHAINTPSRELDHTWYPYLPELEVFKNVRPQ